MIINLQNCEISQRYSPSRLKPTIAMQQPTKKQCLPKGFARVVSALKETRLASASTDVVGLINAFVENADPFAIVKHGMVDWCEHDAKKPAEYQLVSQPNYQRLFMDALQTLTRYDKIDLRVLEYCVGNFARTTDSTQLSGDDVSTAMKLSWTVENIVVGGSLEVVQWMLQQALAGATRISLGTQLLDAAGAYRQPLLLSYLETATNSLGRLRSTSARSLFDLALPQGNAEYYVRSAVCTVGNTLGSNMFAEGSFMRMRRARAEQTVKAIVGYECNRRYSVLTSHAADHVARIGSMDLVMWMYARGVRCSQAGIDGAAGRGHVDVVKWLMDNDSRLRLSPTAVVEAAISGCEEMVCELRASMETKMAVLAMALAASRDHKQAVRALGFDDHQEPLSNHRHFMSRWTVLVTHTKNRQGKCRLHYVVDGYALEARCSLTIVAASAIECAAARGDVQLLASLWQSTQTDADVAFVAAAANGHTDTVQWLLEAGVDGGEKAYLALTCAASNGHDDVVNLLLTSLKWSAPDRFWAATVSKMKENSVAIPLL